MLSFVFLQNISPSVADTTALGAGERSVSYFDLALKGGWVMIPIAILSVIAVYVFIERFMAVRNASKIDQNFMISLLSSRIA